MKIVTDWEEIIGDSDSQLQANFQHQELQGSNCVLPETAASVTLYHMQLFTQNKWVYTVVALR